MRGHQARRRAALLALVLTVPMGAVGLPSPTGASPGADCSTPGRLFAVAAGTGRLVELATCRQPASIVRGAEVDAGDWRGARHLFAAADGPVTVVYAVTTDGRLEARRQAAPGAPLDPPVRVGAGIDWSRFRAVVASASGYLVGDDGELRAFRHLDWSAGGAEVVEGAPLLDPRGEWATLGDLVLTAVRPGGYAEAAFGSTHFKVWRESDGTALAYASGALPAGTATVTGAEPSLYGVRAGVAVQLTQPPHPPVPPAKYYHCPANPKTWQVAAELPGPWAAVAAPVSRVANDWPAVGGLWRGPTPWTCPQDVVPYEWQ